MTSSRDLTFALALVAGTLLGACGSSTEVLEGEGGAGGALPGAGPGGSGPGPDAGAGGAGGDPASGCSSTAQCIADNGGLPYVCGADGACLSLMSPDCTRILGDVADLADERVVVVGVMAPLSGAGAAIGQQQVDAIELALGELDEVVGGLPVDGEPAPVVAVVCDELPAPAAAAAHLVDGVGARLVLGPSGSEAVAAAATGVVATGALLLSPSADGPDLPAIADDGLIWQAASVARHGEAMAAVVARVEGQLPAGEHRLALVVDADDARMAAVADAFLAAVTLNDRSGPANAESGSLIQLVVSPEDPTAAAAAILDLDADLVVAAAPEALSALVDGVETAGAPRWIAGPSPEAVGSIVDAVGERLLVVQTGAPSDRSALDPFSVRFASATSASPAFAASEAYDGAYLGLLALAATGTAEADGEAIAAAIPRLIGAGPRTLLGPADLAAVLATLAAGGGVDLVGTAGSLDAELGTGSAPRSHQVLCVTGGELTGSGLIAGEDGELVGRSSCL